MSQGGVSERIAFLRRRVAAIEARDAPGAAPADPGPLGAPDPSFCCAKTLQKKSPPHALENALNGLSGGFYGEIVPARAADAPAAAGFALALALRAGAARPNAPLVWIVEDMAAREIGLPYARGLTGAGLDPARLALIRTRRPRETLWAMEEALKTPAAAVIAESWMAPGDYGLAPSRRLLLAARRGGGTGLLALPGAAGNAARIASAAVLRFEAAARPGALPRGGVLAPSALDWRLRTVRARAGPLAAFPFDPQRWRDIAFDSDTALFRHAFSGRLPAPSCDRPAVAPA